MFLPSNDEVLCVEDLSSDARRALLAAAGPHLRPVRARQTRLHASCGCSPLWFVMLPLPHPSMSAMPGVLLRSAFAGEVLGDPWAPAASARRAQVQRERVCAGRAQAAVLLGRAAGDHQRAPPGHAVRPAPPPPRARASLRAPPGHKLPA